MKKHGKKYRAALEKIEPARKYAVDDAVKKLKEIAFVKFDETVELAMWLGVNRRKADQLVRGTIVLPDGLGRSKAVLVIAQGDKIKEAEEAGADFVGGEDMVTKIKGGWLEFDAVIATPDMMRLVGGLGKVLGPRGLMPNPKTGTVTFDVKTAVRETKAGKGEELGRQLREAGVTYSVVKNTLARKASAGTPLEPMADQFKGVTAVALSANDPVGLSKAISKFTKANPDIFSFKVGLVEGKVVELREVESIASLPSRDDLLSKVLFLINAQAQRLVTVLQAVSRNLAVVTEQVRARKEAQGA